MTQKDQEATQSPVSAEVEARFHNTPRTIWDALARVCKVTESHPHQWVTIRHDGAVLTFYGPKLPGGPDAVPTGGSAAPEVQS